MLYLKIAIVYAILFVTMTSLVLMTSFDNPAFVFFIPSGLAMMTYGKLTLGKPQANISKQAFLCGLTFSIATVGLSAIVNVLYDWLKNPGLLYTMAFAGNFLFPLLLFPGIHRARNS